MKINDFLLRMWKDYSDLKPHINKVLDLIKEKESKTIINDHIALRTFNHKKINRHVLSSYFVKNGYKPIEDLTFTKKKPTYDSVIKNTFKIISKSKNFS